ncbi:hypothetical protein AAP_01591 [Ascosphaera apis ARSEF 7405]|uniref:Inositolphosphotransferase Aur1/Ipt1 domain-containing protein n=1 Tax=Ascosphaera apis ARSEF 7405 TaxID=392613 RepID=A0A162ILA8_9EURO|nr:hypothetical protein AAP_01591 [Ascosphaera apis ARSEF 7405]
MGLGAVLEPSIVIFLLFGGTWINRAHPHTNYASNHTSGNWRDAGEDGEFTSSRRGPVLESDSETENEIQISGKLNGLKQQAHECATADSSDSGDDSSALDAFDPDNDIERALSSSLLPHQEPTWRTREVSVFGWKKKMVTPNTARFRNHLLSRLLAKFPFLVEAWYWALVYWTYQLGRAFTALTLQESTVNVARKHALQIIELEKSLKIFIEPTIQGFFLARPGILKWINWLYSFIHIPGTIAFLVWLYYYTTKCNRSARAVRSTSCFGVTGGPGLYQARRRALAICNLVAFIVFTLWPCMPPRLLSDKAVGGAVGDLARSYGFVDTVHGVNGASSVWTQNKFCNQYAAMPSLHFGYSFLIGLTIMTVPLNSRSRSRALYIPIHSRPYGDSATSSRKASYKICLPSWQRMICITVGTMYPLAILTAIVSTANHFILDAVAGAIVCIFSLYANKILLNLLWIEDWFLWCVRIHKPDPEVAERRRQRALFAPETMN